MQNLNNFFSLLNLIDVKIKNPEQYLQWILNNPQYGNGYCLDLIDYEKLIAIEIQESKNEKIQSLLKEIKTIIAKNYFDKQRLIIRLENH